MPGRWRIFPLRSAALCRSASEASQQSNPSNHALCLLATPILVGASNDLPALLRIDIMSPVTSGNAHR
jgi:hypothetical protein